MGVVARSERLQQYFERLGFTQLDYETVEDAFCRVLGSNDRVLTERASGTERNGSITKCQDRLFCSELRPMLGTEKLGA